MSAAGKLVSPLELVELELLELLEELELLELELLELELLELELSVDVCPPQASSDTTVQKSKIRFIDPPAHRVADAFIILAIYIPLKLPAIETEKGLRRVKRCNPSANNEFVTLSPFRFDKLSDRTSTSSRPWVLGSATALRQAQRAHI